MRWNHRIKRKIGNRTFTFFVMVAETQSLEGITSQVVGREGYHYPLFGIEKRGENLGQDEVELKMGKLQISNSLPDIFLNSDKEGSYRGYCFAEVTLIDYLRMQLDLIDAGILDYNFFWWTVNKSKSTLRVNQKKNRPKQELVSTLHSYSVPIPDRFERALYDTGVQKRGLTIFLGDKARVIRGDN